MRLFPLFSEHYEIRTPFAQVEDFCFDLQHKLCYNTPRGRSCLKRPGQLPFRKEVEVYGIYYSLAEINFNSARNIYVHNKKIGRRPSR